MKIIAYFVVSALMVCSSLSTVYANQEDKMTKAQELVAKARVSLRSGQLKKAIKLFKQAHKYVPTSDYLFAIASIHSRIEGNCLQTIDAWEQFLRSCPDCSRKSKGEKQIKFHKKYCQVTINVDSDPSGADVTFDDLFIGKTPISFRTIAGKHFIKWTLDKHHPYESEVILLKGRELAVKRATLIPINAVPKDPLIPEMGTKPAPAKPVQELKATSTSSSSANDGQRELIFMSTGGALTVLGIVSLALAHSEIDALNNAGSPEEYQRLEIGSNYALKQGLGYTSIGLGLGLLSYGLLKFEF